MSFKLANSSQKHSIDVKAVSCSNNSDNYYCSGSRDGFVKVHSRNGGPIIADYKLNAFVNSVKLADSFIIAGSMDKVISIFSLANDSMKLAADQHSAPNEATILTANPLSPIQPIILAGHSDNVCSLDYYNQKIYSASWDKTIRIWKGHRCILVCSGHAAAVWCVKVIDDSRFLTASADKTIKLWNSITGVCLATFTGHTDVVRAIDLLPAQNSGDFVSCSNDLTLRTWSFSQPSACLTSLHGHTSFVYSVKALPSTTEIISCGEDRSIRVWKDSINTQTIFLPCISVWCIDVFSNGDIISGSSDGFVRIFTRSPERKASAEEIELFEQSVAVHAQPANQIGDIEMDKLPGLEALTKPGSKPGQTIMVKSSEGVEAHQWDESSYTWLKIGQVIDSTSKTQKKMHGNVEYDYVFDVDVIEGASPLKLPVNVVDDPYVAAQNFINVNDLPQSYLEQIANFVITNTKNDNGPAPMTSGGFVDPFTGSSRYIPQTTNSAAAPSPTASNYLQVNEYLSFKSSNPPAILRKIEALNIELEPVDMRLSDMEMQSVRDLCAIFSTVSPNDDNNVIGISDAMFTAALKIAFTWPPAKRFPGLDLIRLASIHDAAGFFRHIEANVFDFGQTLAAKCMFPLPDAVKDDGNISREQETCCLLGLRILSNFVCTIHGRTFLQQKWSGGVPALLRVPWTRILVSSATPIRLSLVSYLYNIMCISGISGNDVDADIVHVFTLVLGDVSTPVTTGDEVELVFRLGVAMGKLCRDHATARETARTLGFPALYRSVCRAESAVTSDTRLTGLMSELSHLFYLGN